MAGTIGGQPDTPAARILFQIHATIGIISQQTLAELSDTGTDTSEDCLLDVADLNPEDLVVEINKLDKSLSIPLLNTPLIQAGIRGAIDAEGTLDPDLYGEAYGECPSWGTSCTLPA